MAFFVALVSAWMTPIACNSITLDTYGCLSVAYPAHTHPQQQ